MNIRLIALNIASLRVGLSYGYVMAWAGKPRAVSNAAQAVINAGVNMAVMFVSIPAHSPTAGPTRRKHRYQQLVTLSIYP
jgi:hypothetical protein